MEAVNPPAFDVRHCTSIGKSYRSKLEFSPEEVVRLCRAALARGEQTLADIIRIAAFAGGGIKSLFGLRPEDVQTDQATGILTLRMAD
jgi:hypothetical protein